MLSFWFPPLHSGAGMQAYFLSRILNQKGIKVQILTSRNRSLKKTEVIDGNIRVTRLNAPGFYRFSSTLGALFFAINAVLFLLRKKNEYDILHIHGASLMTAFPCFVAKLLGKSVILKTTMLGADDPISLLQKARFGPLQVYLFSFADVVIATSTALQNAVICSKLWKKVKVLKIPNGVDTQKFYQVSKQEKQTLKRHFDFPTSKTIITFVGGISKRKGIDFLIEVWKVILKVREDVCLLLVGPIEEEQLVHQIQAEFDQGQLTHNIRLLGKRDDVDQILRASDIFVFPSRREGLPNALLEAMACGLPSVVLDIKGIISDIIDDGKEGYIVYEEDTKSFAGKLLKLFEDNNLRNVIGKLARLKIEERFSIDRVAEKYIKLYHSI